MHFNRLLGAALAALFFLGAQNAEAASSPLTQKRGTITTQNLVPAGACTSGGCVESEITTAGSVTVQVVGTYTASGGLSAQATTDGTNWVTLCSSTCSTTFTRATTGATSATIASGVEDVFQVPATGYKRLRITALGAVTGTATITIQPTELVPSGFASISGGAGDASAANQVTGNASLASIESYTSRLLSSAVPTAGGAATSTTALGVGGRYNATPPTLTDGQEAGAQLDSSGNLKVKASVASGGIASGAVASGAFASGALASGSVASGAMVDLGAQADSAAAADTSTASLIALVKRTNQNLTTLNTTVGADPSSYVGTTGSTVPTKAILTGAKSGANIVAITQGSATVAINVSTATTTELVALTSSSQIRVTSASVIANGTGTIKFVYGTGTNCGTGTTDLTGAYPLVANAGLTIGGGLGAAIIVPASQALCVTTSAAVQMSGHVTYAKYAD